MTADEEELARVFDLCRQEGDGRAFAHWLTQNPGPFSPGILAVVTTKLRLNRAGRPKGETPGTTNLRLAMECFRELRAQGRKPYRARAIAAERHEVEPAALWNALQGRGSRRLRCKKNLPGRNISAGLQSAETGLHQRDEFEQQKDCRREHQTSSEGRR